MSLLSFFSAKSSGFNIGIEHVIQYFIIIDKYINYFLLFFLASLIISYVILLKRPVHIIIINIPFRKGFTMFTSHNKISNIPNGSFIILGNLFSFV